MYLRDGALWRLVGEAEVRGPVAAEEEGQEQGQEEQEQQDGAGRGRLQQQPQYGRQAPAAAAPPQLLYRSAGCRLLSDGRGAMYLAEPRARLRVLQLPDSWRRWRRRRRWWRWPKW